MSMQITTPAQATEVVNKIIEDLTKSINEPRVKVYADFPPEALIIKEGDALSDITTLSFNVEVSDAATNIVFLAAHCQRYTQMDAGTYAEVNEGAHTALTVRLYFTADYIEQTASGFVTEGMRTPSYPYPDAPLQYHWGTRLHDAIMKTDIPLWETRKAEKANAVNLARPSFKQVDPTNPALIKYRQRVSRAIAKTIQVDFGANYANRVGLAYRLLRDTQHQLIASQNISPSVFIPPMQDPSTHIITWGYANHLFIIHPLLVMNTTTGYIYYDALKTNRTGLTAKMADEYIESNRTLTRLVKLMSVLPLFRTPVLKTDAGILARTKRVLYLAESADGNLRFNPPVVCDHKTYNLNLLNDKRILPDLVPSGGLANPATTFVFVTPSQDYSLIVTPYSIQLFRGYTDEYIRTSATTFDKVPQVAIVLARAASSSSPSAMCRDALKPLLYIFKANDMTQVDYQTLVACLNNFELAYNLRKKLPVRPA